MSNQSKDEFIVFRDLPGNEKTSSNKAEATQNNPQSRKGEDSKPGILIIDDDLHVREALQIIFKNKYQVILCANGQAGIDNVNTNVFAVILDIKMEGKNGFDTFAEIKKKNLYLPIIFLTAYQDLKDPLEIMNSYRPFGYVIKGAESKQILDTTESAVNYYQQINKNTFLVKALQSKNLALQELRENLEIQVEKRTEELTNTNRKLQAEVEIRQKAEDEVNILLKEKEIILQEVHHRIKNNMTTLKSIISLQAGMLKDEFTQKALQETENRIHTMLVLYDKLYQSMTFERMSVNEYIPQLVKQIIENFPTHEYVQLTIKVEDFILDIKRLQPLGIIINELLTNIMKYAFTNKTEGQINVELGIKSSPDITPRTAYLIVQDNGNGFPDSINAAQSGGFGHRLIELLTKQLKGKMQFEQVNGIRFNLEFKL